MPVRTPVGSSCRLDYGRERDALDLAIVYGFADTSSEVADIAHAAHRGQAGENLTLLADLQQRAAECASPAAVILRAAAEHQARVIQQETSD